MSFDRVFSGDVFRLILSAIAGYWLLGGLLSFYAALMVGGGVLLLAAGAGAWARENGGLRKKMTGLEKVTWAAIAAAAFGVVDALYWNFIVESALGITIIHWFSFLGAIIGFVFFSYRIKHQERQIDNQIEQTLLQKQQFNHQREESRKKDEQIRKHNEEKSQKETDDKFRSDIKSMSSIDPLVCIQSMQSLHQTAIKDVKYSQRVASQLCLHIRSATGKAEYQEKNNLRPSEEIQTAIDLLFRDVNGIEGLYKNPNIAAALPNADLSRAYLAGADFGMADCQKANFGMAKCQGADFFDAKCQGAYFSKANCMGADFEESRCQGAIFQEANCQGAMFINANLQGTDFLYAECQGANFNRANCQGAVFAESNCQGANFGKMNCQGANFQDANCQGAHALDENTWSVGIDLTVIISQLFGRIRKKTKIKNMVFSGQITSDCMQSITEAKEFLDESWLDEMQKIIEDNKGKPISYDMPKNSGMVTGILEDGEDIQAIIAELEAIEKAKEEACE